VTSPEVNTNTAPRLHSVELMTGSLVVERYEYGTRSGGVGVQWLAEVVSKDGNLLCMRACKTRKEALETLLNTPRWYE
jgi:hypothetical protein